MQVLLAMLILLQQKKWHFLRWKPRRAIYRRKCQRQSWNHGKAGDRLYGASV